MNPVQHCLKLIIVLRFEQFWFQKTSYQLPTCLSVQLSGTQCLWYCLQIIHYLFFKVILQKEEDDKPLQPVDSNNVHRLSSLRMQDAADEEELQMLASLKREQEEDECRGSGLSASQIHHCNVSISMSIDDASTWTHISMVRTILLLYSCASLLDSPPARGTCRSSTIYNH